MKEEKFKNYEIRGDVLLRKGLDSRKHLMFRVPFGGGKYDSPERSPCFDKEIFDKYKDKIKFLMAVTKDGTTYSIRADSFLENAIIINKGTDDEQVGVPWGFWTVSKKHAKTKADQSVPYIYLSKAVTKRDWENYYVYHPSYINLGPIKRVGDDGTIKIKGVRVAFKFPLDGRKVPDMCHRLTEEEEKIIKQQENQYA